MRYFTSDLHFGHKPIIEFCDRPYRDVEHMNWVLLARINETVKPDDLLYILGDFSFYPKDQNVKIVKDINCPVVLIRGNHDHNNRIKGVGFADVHDELDIQLGKHLVTLSHFPYWIAGPDGHERREGNGTIPDRYKDRRPKDVGLWLLHGHTHDTGRIRKEFRMIHVGVEAWQYAPIAEVDIIKMIDS